MTDIKDEKSQAKNSDEPSKIAPSVEKKIKSPTESIEDFIAWSERMDKYKKEIESLKQGDDSRALALYNAARNGKLETMARLVASGAPVNHLLVLNDGQAVSPLTGAAVYTGDSDIQYEMIKFLLGKGAIADFNDTTSHLFSFILDQNPKEYNRRDELIELLLASIQESRVKNYDSDLKTTSQHTVLSNSSSSSRSNSSTYPGLTKEIGQKGQDDEKYSSINNISSVFCPRLGNSA